ncbi:MAG: hypothetical protein K2H52_16085 [Lachnospiraceae bacterium]|nr:hypothetical protein [Lachnospiraceae bacterium]
MSGKTDYTKKLKPIYIDSIEANHLYIDKCAKSAKKESKRTEYKIGNSWFEFQKVKTRKAVLNDSLFLRYMNNKIVRYSSDFCRDFIVVKFNYDAEYRIDSTEEKVTKHDLRNIFYKNGVDYTFEKKNRKGEIVERIPIHFKMLMRSTGKAKQGECVFVRDSLHHKAINFLTMGLYDLMDKQSKDDPEKVFKLVELSAYQTLTTATAKGYIQIPLENILVVKDEAVYSDGMNAAIVNVEDKVYFKPEYELDFESPRLERIINKKGYTFDEDKAKDHGLILITEKSKDALKGKGFRINGKYPGKHKQIEYTKKECVVNRVSDAKIKNILFDGMGLIDENVFPKNMDGFIYCRSHFFKSCLFRGNIQEFFRDYCDQHGLDYDTYIVQSDMFGRRLRLKDVKVIITDKSLKWLNKFVDMMGGTEKKAYKYYYNYMKRFDDYFSIVKTARPSHWGDLQLMAYQMDNSVPTTDKEVLERITECGVNFCNELKNSDIAYLRYLNKTNNDFNINDLLIELVAWNSDFLKTEFFRNKKSRDISKFIKGCKEGRLPQIADNLTIMDNPVALLMKAVGEEPLEEGCFELMQDGVQCYAPRFNEGERLAAFRSPHNSPNNIIHLYNVYPNKLIKYFPNIGQNVIVFNAIKTDTQARLSGHDCDSDFVYVTNQKDLADLARKAYVEYSTIINNVDENGANNYHFTLEDYAEMDNQIADAQESIGTSTDTAQLALSYYYDGGMESKELEDCFIILSVIGQISIDLAKKCFDIDVVREINRIRNLPCMKRNEIPQFFASNKKSRNNKDFEGKKVISMNCPMDIMAQIIEDNVIGYADRESHLPLRNFWNHAVIAKGNRYKKDKFVEEVRSYNKTDKWLEKHEAEMSKETFFSLKNRNMTQLLAKVSKELDQETIMQLVIYATDDNNSDVRATILNFLFKLHRDEFMNCFIKNGQNQGETLAQNA